MRVSSAGNRHTSACAFALGGLVLLCLLVASLGAPQRAEARPAACKGKVKRGSGSADNLRGRGGSDVIIGRGGRDRINPRGGRDCVIAGRGSDRIQTSDGKRDIVLCGPGARDRVTADRRDRLRGCERARISGKGKNDSSGCKPNLRDLEVPDCAGPTRRDTGAEQFTDEVPWLWGQLECENSPFDPSPGTSPVRPGSRVANPASGGDDHLLSDGTVAANTAWRSLSLFDGDDYYGHRCELGRNFSGAARPENQPGQSKGTFATYRPGTRRITFFSLRLPERFPATAEPWQLVMQMRQSNPSDYQDANPEAGPVFSLEARQPIWSDRPIWMFDWSRPGVANDNRFIWTAPARTGRWVRFAIDITFSQSKKRGRVVFYADLNGDGDARDPGEMSRPGDRGAGNISDHPKRGATLPREPVDPGGDAGDRDGVPAGGGVPLHLRLGLYNDSSISCPRNVTQNSGPDCSLGIDNVEVVTIPR